MYFHFGTRASYSVINISVKSFVKRVHCVTMLQDRERESWHVDVTVCIRGFVCELLLILTYRSASRRIHLCIFLHDRSYGGPPVLLFLSSHANDKPFRCVLKPISYLLRTTLLLMNKSLSVLVM